MKSLSSIVVGLDHAQRIASWAGAQVHPVHVVDAPVDEMPEEAALTVMRRGIREGLVEDARKRRDEFAAGTRGHEAQRLRSYGTTAPPCTQGTHSALRAAT